MSSREPTFKRYLVTHNLIRVNEVGDGNCMLRAIARYFHGHPSRHTDVRARVVEFMANNPGLFIPFLPHIGIEDDRFPPEREATVEAFNNYIRRMRMDRQEGDNAFLYAAAVLYRITIYYYDFNTGVEHPINPGATPNGEHPLYLHYVNNGIEGHGNNGHWDTLQPLAANNMPWEPPTGIIPGLDDDMELAVPIVPDETDGQQEVVPNAGAGSPPATCARCKRPVHLGKVCGGAPSDAEFAAETAAEAAVAEPEAEHDAEPEAEHDAELSVPEPAVAEPVVAEPVVAEPAVAEPAAAAPIAEPAVLPAQPALFINLNPGNAQMDADSPINNNPNPSFSFLPFSS